MSQASVKGKINAPADKVWKTISTFRDIEKFLPAIASSHVEGSGVGAIRTLTTPDGAKITERLEGLDENTRTLTYSIIDSPLPFENYVSDIQVHDSGNNQCELEWSSVFKPKGAPEGDVKNLIESIYKMAIEGLNKLHGS